MNLYINIYKKMDNMFKDLYQKENLTFDEILVMLNNNYDPDKKLLLKLMEYFANKKHKLYEYVTFCNLLPKIIDNYDDIKINESYLNYACQYKNIEIIELLLFKNAKLPCWLYNDRNFSDVPGISDLIIKITEHINKYKDKRIEIILENIYLTNYENTKKFYNIVFQCKNSTDIIKVIISSFATKIICDNYFIFSRSKLPEFLESIKNSDELLFIELLTDIKKIVELGRCEEMVIELIKYKFIPINDFVYGDETPLTFLIKSNKDVSKLKNCGIDFNLKNKLGETPFNIAIKRSCICNFPETTLKMLDLGCNPYIKDKDNKDGIDTLKDQLGNYYREQYVNKAINIIKGYKFKN